MATVKWTALSAVINALINADMASLANNAYTGLGTAVDNSSNLHRWGWLELKLGSIDPVDGACIFIFLIPSFDGGTDYDDGPSTNNPCSHNIVATVSVNIASSAKKITYGPISLPPGLFKFAIRNSTGVALNASNNTLDLYTNNESVA